MTPSEDYQIYALKTEPEESKRVYDRMKEDGFARFGWSYIDTGNLQQLRTKEGRTKDEEECWKHASFLLDVKAGDYLVYINMPEWGRCTVAKVNGTYEWNKWGDDYNHAIPVDNDSVKEFDRNDKDIHPSLSRRFKLQRAWWRIYLRQEFADLLTKLARGELTGQLATVESRFQQLIEKLTPILQRVSSEIHMHNPEKKLEELVANTLKNIPGQSHIERKQGRADFGADIIFEYDSGLPFLPRLEKCAIQVKSFEGRMDDKDAIRDIERAFRKDEDVAVGLIVSTATSISDEFGQDLDKLAVKEGKPVHILYGEELAKWFIRYGMQPPNIGQDK